MEDDKTPESVPEFKKPDNPMEMGKVRKAMSKKLEALKTDSLEALIMSKRGLSDRQRLFLEEYLKDMNVVEAARRASVSNTHAYKWVRLAEFREVVESRLEIIRKEYEVVTQETVGQLRQIINADLGEYQEWNETVVRVFDSKTLEKTSVVKEVYNTEWGPRLVLYDKMQAIKQMTEILGLVDKMPKQKKELEQSASDESLFEALTRAHEERAAKLQARAKDAKTDEMVSELDPAGALPAPDEGDES